MRPTHPSALADDVVAFHRESLVFDLHIDTLLWTRLIGYDLAKRHENRVPLAPFAWHMDLPRAREAGLDGAVLGLVINPREVRSELILPLKLMAALERRGGFEQTLQTLDLLAEAAARTPNRLEPISKT